MRIGWIIVAGVLALLPAQSAYASSQTQLNSRFLTVYGPSKPPIGYREFCARHPSDCRLRLRSERMHLTSKNWDDLQTINELVNRTITPESDLTLYGRLEHWTYPGKRGDCEDYVLAKRRMLLKRGWPASALLITVVRDEIGDGHAILTVRTTSGDVVLDNRLDDVVAWHALPYDFVKRQSSVNPMAWVALTPLDNTLMVNLGATTKAEQ